MLGFDPQLKVWTIGSGPRARWKCRFGTGDLDEAMKHAEVLAAEGEWPCVSELAAFEHEQKHVVSWVTFWWCAALNDEMEGAPEGRGSGWYDDEDVFVSYDYQRQTPGPWGAILPASSVPRVHATPAIDILPPFGPGSDRRDDHEQQFVEVSCDDCGLIGPMNVFTRIEREVQTGRSSGTNRTFVSRGNGHSRSGTSYMSGRKYFKTQEVLLCAPCRQIELERRQDNRPLLVQLAEGVFTHFLTRR